MTPPTLLEILASSLTNILSIFSDQITFLSIACYCHIRQLRCMRPYLDSSSACTIATYIFYFKLDYCNVLYYKFHKSQLFRLQQIQNSLARTVVKAPKSFHITPILRSLHWLRVMDASNTSSSHLAYLQTISLRQPHSGTSSSISYSPIPLLLTSSSFDSPVCSSITPSLFHSQLKTYLFHKSHTAP